jgi:hypothetical protein
MIAGVLGMLPNNDIEIKEMIRLLSIAKIKLDQAGNKTLEMMIGIVYTNNDLPSASCSRSSLNEKAIVRKSRKILPVTQPGTFSLLFRT